LGAFEVPRIGAVLIGRNEGARLVRALAAIAPHVAQVVYVDSGSTDDSIAAAQAAGAGIVSLDMTKPFTAARARNAGTAHLIESSPPGALPDYIQFLDGDCALQPDWLSTATTFLDNHPEVAVVCGRRREQHPEASVYNALCDAEWDTPIGLARACGGDALMRTDALQQVGGYNPTLIAGEEPEMCVRLRAKGWKIWRLDAEMTLHDAAMTRFSQWWKRTRRAGHAYAEGAALHGAPPERHFAIETRRAVIWGLAIPAAVIIAALILGPWMLLGFGVYPLQLLRLSRRTSPTQAFFLTLGKFAEGQGVLEYLKNRLSGRQGRLIEYK
jgi:GT2 family glycosyltransferase